jgi:hypothetical protein
MLNAVKVVAVLYLVIGVIHSIVFGWVISRNSCLTARGLVAIYCNSGVGFSHFVVTLAWPLYWLQPTESNAQNLTGTDRQDFIAGAVNSCMRKYGLDGTDLIPRALFEQYCRCYANGLADRLSAKELREEKPEIVRPVIQAEGPRCYQAIKDEAMSRSRSQSK